MKEKYIATMVAAGLGDTLGMPVEGWKHQQIRRYIGAITTLIDPFQPIDTAGQAITEDEFGKIKQWTKDFKKGQFTDDTILTLALAESLIACKGMDLEDIALRMLHEYTIRKQADGSVSGGFGGTTIDAMKNLEQGLSPKESAPVPGGPGNGTAMKTAPLGLYMHASAKAQEVLEFSELVARITHRYPPSIAAGVVQTAAVCYALEVNNKLAWLDILVDVARTVESRYEKQLINLSDKLIWIRSHRGLPDTMAQNILNNRSHVLESYPFAVFMSQKYWNNPLKGLLRTVNFGGDCDTTAAMFGAIAGARHGIFYPGSMVADLQNLDQLMRIGKTLYALRTP